MLYKNRYAWNGETFTAVVAADVVALPDIGEGTKGGWSYGGFGTTISLEWLDHEGVFAGLPKPRRKLAAELVVQVLADAHGYEPRERIRAFRADYPPNTRAAVKAK